MHESNLKIDNKDREIIYQLDINSRQPISRIAKKVGLSQQVVNYRLNNLIKNEIIKCVSLLDLSKIGYFIHKVKFRFKNTNKNKFNEIVEYIKNNDRVWAVLGVDGLYDLDVSILARNVVEFSDILSEWLYKFEKYIHEKKLIGVILQREYLNRSYLIKNKKRELDFKILKKQWNETAIDKKDVGILKALAKDSRTFSIDIARKLNISAENVAKRIKQLEKTGVIEKYGICIDNEKIGQIRYMILLGLNQATRKREESFLEFCGRHPKIFYINKICGNWDAEIGLEVQNYYEYHEIISDLKNYFSDVIKWCNPLIVHKFYKYDSFPMNDLTI